MIRNVLIMTITGGLLLFSQEFPGSIQQPRLGGQLITAIIEFGHQTTGMAVSHINLTNISIAIVTNEPNNLFCALFYDRSDGKLFGKLICSEILSAFIQNYASDPQFAQTGRNLKDFIGFQRKLQRVVYYAIRPVVSLLESKNGINKAFVLRELEIIDSQKESINEFQILANLPNLIDVAEELLLYGNGLLQSVIIDSDSENERVMIWKIREQCYLICVIDNNKMDMKSVEVMEESLSIIEQIYTLHESLGLYQDRDAAASKKAPSPIHTGPNLTSSTTNSNNSSHTPAPGKKSVPETPPPHQSSSNINVTTASSSSSLHSTQKKDKK